MIRYNPTARPRDDFQTDALTHALATAPPAKVRRSAITGEFLDSTEEELSPIFLRSQMTS